MPYLAARRTQRAKGFMELDQLHAILTHLPTDYRPLFELAYITGWRIRSELLSRQWRHVDFNGKGWLSSVSRSRSRGSQTVRRICDQMQLVADAIQAGDESRAAAAARVAGRLALRLLARRKLP